jgi:TonB family protein
VDAVGGPKKDCKKWTIRLSFTEAGIVTTKLSPHWIPRKRVLCAAAVFFVFVLGCSLLASQESSGKNAQSTENDTVYEPGNGLTPPKGVYMPNAEYSEKARKKKISGTVVVGMVVTADGKVRDVKVTQSLEPSLDQQAIAAVQTWKFEPATKDGKPVAVHIHAEITFRIR